jgi:hypothetical protein
MYVFAAQGGAWTVGCRLHSGRNPICAMYDDTGRGAGTGGRIFEISNFQAAGAAEKFGGGPFTPALDAAWRVCRGTDPDTNCRDRFRWELTKDTLTIFVNGVKYMEHKGLPSDKQLPDVMLNGNVYVYFSDWIYKPDASVIRFHWDRLAVNPGTPPGPAPGWGGTVPTPTPTRPGTATPTAMPTGTAAATTCEVRVRIGGVEQWLMKPLTFCQ